MRYFQISARSRRIKKSCESIPKSTQTYSTVFSSGLTASHDVRAGGPNQRHTPDQALPSYLTSHRALPVVGFPRSPTALWMPRNFPESLSRSEGE